MLHVEVLETRAVPTATVIGAPTLTIADHAYTLRVVDDTHAAIDRPDGTTIIAIPEWATGVQIVAQYSDPGTPQPEMLHFLYSGTTPGGTIQIWDQQSSDFGEHFGTAMLAMEILPPPESEAQMMEGGLGTSDVPGSILPPATQTVQPEPIQAMPKEVLPAPTEEPAHQMFDAALALAQDLRFHEPGDN